MNMAFAPGSESRQALGRWWASLEHDRGTRAELKRCASTLQVMQVAGFHSLRGALLQAGLTQRQVDSEQLPVVVAILAHIRESGDRKPAQAFSSGETPADPPPVSPLRFRQMLEARTPDELLLRLRRVLPLARRLDAMQLAWDAFHWSDRVRKQWVYDYRWPSRQGA